jgi:3-hydroxy-3-methylglutaryl CoA synthase
MTVGIDDLNVYGSALSVAAVDLARARGGSERQVTGLGLLRRSLPPAFEDPVTLAANAARPLPTEGVELLVVASESGVDFAKPISSYVHRHLGLAARCRHVEVKHACYGGTAGLLLAAAWVRANPGKRALVVMTDMARRLFGDPAEPAEGAGAAALLVAEDPRVLALDPWSGVCAREVYDVMRPTPTREVIHSALSLAAYLDLLEVAWAGYGEAAGPGAFERLEWFAYHTPVPPLVEQAHALVVDDRADAAAHFDARVRPSLRYTRELGNTYSACLYAALAGLCDAGAAGRVGLYSYGSGSCAEYFSGVLGPRARETVGRHAIAAALEARRPVDVPTYERLVAAHEEGLVSPDFTPDRGLVPGLWEEAYAGRGRLVLASVRDHYRAYEWS